MHKLQLLHSIAFVYLPLLVISPKKRSVQHEEKINKQFYQ